MLISWNLFGEYNAAVATQIDDRCESTQSTSDIGSMAHEEALCTMSRGAASTNVSFSAWFTPFYPVKHAGIASTKRDTHDH